MQREVDEWVKQYKIEYFEPLAAMAALSEEVGEIARELNARFGPKHKKPTEDVKEIGAEIADAIFSLICIANPLGIDLQEEFEKMMAKLNQRDHSRWERK